MKTLLQTIPQDTLYDAFNKFECQNDDGLVDFLQNKAEKFEKIGKSRTYILLDAFWLEQKRVVIVGYFSLAMQVMRLPENLSSNAIKRLDGLSSRMHGQRIRDISVYLIGQLARDDKYKGELAGSYVLQSSLSIINTVSGYIGGRVVMIDCKPEKKLIDFYESNGFSLIDYDEETNLNQMIYMLQK